MTRINCCCNPGNSRATSFQPLERHFTGARFLERFGGALVLPARDRVEPHDLARQVKAEHLAFAMAVGRKSLEGARAHDIQGVKRTADGIQALVASEHALDLHHAFELLEVVAADRGRQAQPVQAAFRTTLAQPLYVKSGAGRALKRKFLPCHP